MTFKRIVFISIFSLSIIGCSLTEKSRNEIDITGNWFFIDKEYDRERYYHEVYIDSINLHFCLGNSLFPAYEYKLTNDTIFHIWHDMKPFLVVKDIRPDTLFMEFLSNQVERPSRLLTYIRLGDNEKGYLDYDWTLEQNSDSLFQVYESDTYRRFEEYLIAIGETTRERLDSIKADSSNYITIPDV